MAVAVMRFDETVRTIVDGRTAGFCKLIADRSTGKILGCHVVGERAVEIVQVVAIAMAGELRVDQLARIPLYFPTYAGILVRMAYRAAKQIYRSSAASSSMPSEGLHRLFTWADMLLGRRPAESLPHAKKKSPLKCLDCAVNLARICEDGTSKDGAIALHRWERQTRKND